MSRGSEWTEEEVEYLKANYLTMTANEIAVNLGKSSAHAVHAKANKLNLKKLEIIMTEEKKQFVLDNYSKLSVDEISEILGVTKKNIFDYAHSKRLKSKKYYTDDEIEYIAANISKKSYDDIAKKLGRTKRSLKDKLAELKLGMPYENFPGHIHLCEVARLVGKNRHSIRYTWTKYGLPIKKKYRYVYVKEDDLFEFMEAHPECYKASDCEEWFFEGKQWFKEKQKSEHVDYLKWKWGIEA